MDLDTEECLKLKGYQAKKQKQWQCSNGICRCKSDIKIVTLKQSHHTLTITLSFPTPNKCLARGANVLPSGNVVSQYEIKHLKHQSTMTALIRCPKPVPKPVLVPIIEINPECWPVSSFRDSCNNNFALNLSVRHSPKVSCQCCRLNHDKQSELTDSDLQLTYP